METNLKLKIKGPRIAIVDVAEQNTTGIEFPANAGRAYIFGKVFAVGDNVANGKVQPYFFAVDDIVVFQSTPAMMANCRFEVDGQRFLLILQGDAIAKFNNGQAELNFDSIEMGGEWVLCKIKVHEMVGMLYIPDSARSSPRPPSFLVAKAGPHSGLTHLPVGTELLVERSRATVMQIGKDRYAYLHKDSVYGMIDSA